MTSFAHSTKNISIKTIFLILIGLSIMPLVNATLASCNAGGGIWCNQVVDASSSDPNCLVSKSLLTFNYATLPDCTVSGTQEVNVGSTTLRKYYTKTFTLTNNALLHFVVRGVFPETELSGACVGSGSGCPATQAIDPNAGSAGQSANGDKDGGSGGAGGAGGGQFEAGGNSFRGQGCNNPGQGADGGKPGGNVLIYSQNFILNTYAVLSVDGLDGSDGGSGGDSFTYCGSGSGSGGGSGGGGAGSVVIFAANTFFNSNSKITANGGNGGMAGRPGDDLNKVTGNDDGCFGGSGGGGASGTIDVYYSNSSVYNGNFTAKGGLGGAAPEQNHCDKSPLTAQGIDALTTYSVSEPQKVGETDCTNGLDDDSDNFVDLEDADCYNAIKSIDPSWTNNPGPLTLLSSPGAKSLSGLNSWWNPLAVGGSDGVCGDDFNDVGYIAPTVKRYLCYNYSIAQPSSTASIKYTWLDATNRLNRYKIVTVSNSNGKTDVISNSYNWSYCNAMGRNDYNGLPISEYGTFRTPVQSGYFKCSDLLNNLFSSTTYHKCADGETTNCCFPDNTRPSDQAIECNYECFSGTAGVNVDICKSTGICNSGNDSLPGGSDYDILKNTLTFDMYGLFTAVNIDKSVTCNAQQLPSDYNREICSNSEICVAGSVVNVSDSSNCCIGVGAYCESDSAQVSTNECSQIGGQSYNDASYNCDSSLQISDDGTTRCCVGGTLRIDLLAQAGSTISSSSFMCFKENGQNIISDCCYGKSCPNIALTSSSLIQLANNKVQSLGSALHTFNNYDKLVNGQIVDYYHVFNLTSSRRVDITRQNSYALDMTHFTYLEFDVAYSSSITIAINGRNLGPISKFLTNGDKPNRWHHVVIPLHDNGIYSFNENLGASGITLTADNVPTQISVDNIILTPTGNDLSYNSKNYYCTGGFEGWISDLDPPASVDLSDWSKYGPYMITCNSQGSFKWTGSRCCGDDTKPNTYGEFYTDTQGGCFDGTYLKNDWSLGYAKNYYEGTSENQLDTYNYSGLLYYNNTFIGCQIPNNKIDIYSSAYGVLNTAYGVITADPLVQTFTNTQCAIIGSYYCMDGVWRSKVLNKDSDINAAGLGITLKTAPSGPNLIKNGFR